MASLAKNRAKALAARRAEQNTPKFNGNLAEIRAEGYEDYSYGAKFSNPYKGDEAQAYSFGWNQARLEMTGIHA